MHYKSIHITFAAHMRITRNIFTAHFSRLGLISILMLISFRGAYAQAIGDYGAISTGMWNDPTIWRTWNGAGWVNNPGNWPGSSTTSVYILTGSTVTVQMGGSISVNNLVVQSGAKLFCNNTTTNVYLNIWGPTVTCDGEIGNGLIFDGLGFNIEGTTTTISGSGTLTLSRMRKSQNVINVTSTVVIAMDVTLRWDQASNTQLYNNVSSGNSNFNVTINSGFTLNCAGSPTSPGNVSMDGLGTTGFAPAEAGGTITVNGTLIVPGTLFAGTNNTTAANGVNITIGNGGVLRAGQVNSPASGSATMKFAVLNGGRLELTGIGFPILTANWSTTNNRYDFWQGSTVEYSATAPQTILIPTDFIPNTSPNNNQYWHLTVSGSGNKTLRYSNTIPVMVRGNITIAGSAVLDQDANDPDINIGGNWVNYNQSGFNESTNPVRSVKFYTTPAGAISNITCPGGENFFNLWVSKTGATAMVKMNSPVNITNQLLLGSASTNGVLQLAQNTLTINNPSVDGIKLLGTPVTSSNFRFIISEDAPGNGSMIRWNIGTATGNYVFPFGRSTNTDTLPFFFSKTTTDDIGLVSVATYGTLADNLPWPTAPIPIGNLNALTTANNTPDNRAWTADRFWYVGATNPVTTGCTGIFTYNNRSVITSELPNADPVPGNLKAQFWNVTAATWNVPQVGIASPPGYVTNSVSVPDLPVFNTVWALASISSPLPVELISFTARPESKAVTLLWATASEDGNDFFEVERSTDGISFYPIGRVSGAGTTSSLHNYRFTDGDPVNGLAYYRLRQVDYDGQAGYSKVLPVEMKKGQGGLLYPQPAIDRITWRPETETGDTPVFFRIFSSHGEEVQNFSLPGVNNLYTLDIQHLIPGAYYLRAETGGEVSGTPFLVVRP